MIVQQFCTTLRGGSINNSLEPWLFITIFLQSFEKKSGTKILGLRLL